MMSIVFDEVVTTLNGVFVIQEMSYCDSTASRRASPSSKNQSQIK